MTAFYRALLRLYPTSFRTEYADELSRIFEASVRGRGRMGAALAAIGDVVPNAMAAHWAILAQDLRYTARALKGSRGFALATVLITALGVGANAATFSVADFVLVRPLPFPDPDRLVRLCEGPRTGGGWGCMNQMSPAVYRDVMTKARSFDALGALGGASVNLVGSGEPARLPAQIVTPNLLTVLGVTPLAGRVFDPSRADADEQTVVISYGLWQSQLGGDDRVLGKTLNLDGQQYVVIGVMPAHFRFPTEEVQLWIPTILREDDFANRGNNYLEAVGRLKPGVTFEQARTELSSIALEIEREHPADHPDIGFSFYKQRDAMSPRYRQVLLVLCGASLAMLLLTCANLANLSLARAAGREREIAVRAALGAGRERLVRQMLTESIVLAAIGGVAGALIAFVTVPLLSQLVPPSMPLSSKPSVDVRAFTLAAVFAAVTGLGFGLIPALRVGGQRGFAALREGTRGSAQRQRLRTTLVAIEVAVSVALLIASGLLIRAVWRVQAVPAGFSTEGVLTLRTQLPIPKYDEPGRRADFHRRVLAGVRTLPGVEAASYTSGLPMVFTGGITLILLPGEVDRRDGTQTASIRLVTSQFFSTLQIPLRRGRAIGDEDTRDRQLVAVVSESFAKRHWGGPNDAIGRTFTTRGQERTVVGVVGDIKVRGLERTSEPQLYIPFDQAPVPIGDNYQPKDLLVRSARPEAALVPAIREIVRQVDAQQPISNVRTLSEVVGDQTVTRRAQVRILGALAVLALLLAGVGIHGLLAFTVAQRDREIGVRLALGANPGLVARMIVSEGVRMALIGIVPGVLIAYAAARAMGALLFGVRPEDPLTIAVAAVACFLTAVAACLRPALRAARIDPISALRAD
jgi:predicted permease